MSLITRWLESLFPNKEHRCLFIALDAAGKTTILYKLKLGEVVTTIPTIGFNVETVTYKGHNLTMWDVGGCDKIRPLWRHYYQNTHGLIFVVDSNDRDRMTSPDGKDSWDSAKGLFLETLKEDELKDAVVLIYLNKQDLPGAISVQEFKEKFALDDLFQKGTVHPHRYFVQPCCATSGDGLYEGLDWLLTALKEEKENPKVENLSLKPASNVVEAKKEEQTPTNKQEALMLEWLSREDESDDEFLQKLADYTLESWDHRTHLRIAWILLTRYGRQEGMKRIFSSIKSFIENSPRTKPGGAGNGTENKRGTTFHETMTYFWTHMVHYAMVATKLPENTFKVFLLMNPQLSDGGLFLRYYSKKKMLLDPVARDQVVLPDLKPLPSIVSPAAAAGGAAAKKEYPLIAPSDSKVNVSSLSDADFFQRFIQNQEPLPVYGHEIKLRILFVSLLEHGRGKGGVDLILDSLKRVEGSGFHLTIDYFWVQMICYHVMSLIKSEATKKTGGKWKKEDFGRLLTTSSESISSTGSTISFKEFLQQKSCKELKDQLLYLQYYSKELLDQENSATAFQLPDLKPLPSIVV